MMANPGKMTSIEVDSDISEDESEDLGTVDLNALEESLNETRDISLPNTIRDKDPARIRGEEIKQVRVDEAVIPELSLTVLDQ